MGFLGYWNGLWRRGARAGQPAPRARLYLERLEDRTVPSTWYVANGGDDAPGAGTQGNPFGSIQYAVNQAANSGDKILVAAGTYTEGNDTAAYAPYTGSGTNAVVIVENKSVAIFGGYSTSNWGAAPNPTANPTIIDGQGSYRGVLVLGTSTSEPDAAIDLENFYIQNGLARGNTVATGDDAIFGIGGGVFVNLGDQQNTSATQVFNYDVFRYDTANGENSSSAYGGGGEGGGMALRKVTNAVLTNITFQNNDAKGGSGTTRGGQGLGGALDLDGSAISSALNLTFTANSATGGTSAGSGTTSDGQTADGIGGAVALEDTSSLVLADATATGNVATGGTSAVTAGGGFGGALAADTSSVTITDTTFNGNIVQGGSSPNGGLAAGGGIDVTDSDLSLERVSLVANQAFGGTSTPTTINGNSTTAPNGAVTGGGLYLLHTDSSTVSASLENTVVADNTVQYNSTSGTFTNGGGGGGIWIQGEPTTIYQSTIANNNLGANLYYGSAILLIADQTNAGTTTADISYTIIANNNGPISGANSNGAIQSFAGTSVTTTCNLFANNNGDTSTYGPGQENGGSITDDSSKPSIEATTAGFVSPGAPNENYNLPSTSPAVNAAAGSTETVDRNDLARVGTPDIGAYEYQAPPTPVVQFSAAQFDFFETAQLATVTLTRSVYLNTTSTVWIGTSAGTAVPNTATVDGDYNVPAAVPITFNPGDTTKTFNIALNFANHAESPVVYFYVFLASPSSGTNLVPQNSAQVDLVNNVPGELAKFINGAYHTLIDQPVDATDFVNMYNLLWPSFQSSLTYDATLFLTSPAYINSQIQSVYTTFLGRAAQAADLNYWNSVYAYYAGQAATRDTAFERVLAAIVGSSESIVHNTGTSSTWLNAAYEGLLGRPVDQGGQSYFGAQLNPSQPSTYVSVALEIMQSQEYRDNIVANDYRVLLNRAASAGEIGYYANELATAPRYVVATQIMTSTEYFLDASNSISGWVNRAYSNLLGSTGDTAGAAYHQSVILNGFVNQRAAAINYILASPAYQPVLIQNTFQQILGRAPTSAEVTYGLNYLMNHTDEQFRVVLYGSAEYLQKVGGDLGDWLDQIFLSTLGRPIDGPSFTYFVNQYNAGQTTGQIAAGILATGAYFDDLTNSLYQQLLGRPATSAEQSYFSTALTRGATDEDVIAALLLSPEAYPKMLQQAFP